MTVRDSLDRALAAYERGRAIPPPPLPNMEQRQGVHYLSDISRHLPEAEIELLARAVERREQALGLARQGDTNQARRLLCEARALVEEQVRSAEGRASALSFHAAALSYVDYAEGAHETGYASMLEALLLCRRLRLDHGHRVEVRRVHLARNVMRLTCAMGRPVDAWTLGGELLGYVWHGSAWPLGEATALPPERRETLRDDERLFLTDQILSEAVSTAVAAGGEVELPPWRAEAINPRAQSGRASEIEALCRDLASGREVWLGTLASYLEKGPGELPMTWHRLERLLAKISGRKLASPS
jgi:hypothetical protein